LTAALLLNSVDAATLGLTLAEAPGWLDLPPRQFPTAAIIGRGGAKRLSDAIEQPRRLTLKGMVRASTWAAARANIDALKLALLADPLVVTFADHSDRHVFAVLESFTAPTLAGPFVQENLQIEATLTAYDPLSYSNSLSTITLGVNRLPLGTGPVRPLVTISGASTNPVITLYNTAGAAVASITLTITTVGGDTLSIDMDAKTVKKNGASVIANITAGDFFSIDPLDQVNFGGAGPYINSSSGAGNSTYYKTWR
jgi:phage-related protein